MDQLLSLSISLFLFLVGFIFAVVLILLSFYKRRRQQNILEMKKAIEIIIADFGYETTDLEMKHMISIYSNKYMFSSCKTDSEYKELLHLHKNMQNRYEEISGYVSA